ALHRAGVPMSVATEALLVDILGYYAAVACLTGAAVLVLWLHHGVTAVWIFVLAIFGMVAVFVPVTIHFLLKHPSFQLGTRLRRVKALSRLLETLHGVSRRGVENPEVLTSAAVLHLTIFVLDAATL